MVWLALLVVVAAAVAAVLDEPTPRERALLRDKRVLQSIAFGGELEEERPQRESWTRWWVRRVGHFLGWLLVITISLGFVLNVAGCFVPGLGTDH